MSNLKVQNQVLNFFDYIKSLSKPDNNLSGDTDLLPENLRRAYGSYEAAEEEWHSMKQCGSIHPDDLKYQQIRRWHTMMNIRIN